MVNYEEIAVKVPKEALKRLKNRDTAEIVLRGKQKEYEPFIKCVFDNTSDEKTRKIINDILSPVVKTFSKNDVGKVINETKKINKQIKETGKILNNVSSSIHDLSGSIKQIASIIESSSKLQFINIALSGINLAATVSGFIIIGNMLNNVDKHIKELDIKAKVLIDNELSKLHEKYHNLVMHFNSLATKIKDNDEVSRDEMEEYLRSTNAFIRERLIKNVKTASFDIDDLLSMIYSLLPSYTLILCEFNKDYYFDKHHSYDNAPVFMSLYDDLVSDDFVRSVYDYLFLDKGLYANDSLITVTLHRILVNEQLLEISDQNTLMKETESREYYEELQTMIKESVKEYAISVVNQRGEMDGKDYSFILSEINKAYDLVGSSMS